MKKRGSVALSIEEQKLLTKVMTMGAGTSLPVVMRPSELAKLIGVIYRDTQTDLDLAALRPGLWEEINPGRDYFELPQDWFQEEIQLEQEEHAALLKAGQRQIDDFNTYLLCLSELHKRRRKYSKILASQPYPTMVQISPRSLIEYGTTDSQALASWLTWRKFFFDLDNRAAQESGYLFEPILAAAIGGEPQSAKSKVVCRVADPSKGRQVDCWKVLPSGERLAYEFKLRVTIAASGQGRFAEETQFADDVRHSGATPVLVVLDPTPNPRLADLTRAFSGAGGRVYIGDDAWLHLEQEAGAVMSTFIEHYVRRPIQEIARFQLQCEDGSSDGRVQLLDLYASQHEGKLTLRIGDQSRTISRVDGPKIAEEIPDDLIDED